MEKQTYVKPEVKVIVTDAVQMFAGSLPMNGAGIATDENKGDVNQGADAQGRRGAWGDLWN